MDPSKPRTDYSPNLSSFRDRKATPVKKMQKMIEKLVEARTRADDTNAKMAIVEKYKNKYKLSLSYKLIDTMDLLHLDMSYRLLRLE